MIEKKQSDLHFSNPSLNSTEIPTLNTQTANQLLNNVFEACNMEPNSIPVEVLESWGNYKKPAFDFGKMISYIFILLLILLPLLFFQPNIAAKRINVDSATDATYNISGTDFITCKVCVRNSGWRTGHTDLQKFKRIHRVADEERNFDDYSEVI